MTVNFAGTGLSLSSATASTGNNGQASVTATAVALGSESASASVAGIPTPVSFAETGTLGSPATLTYVSGSGQTGTIGAAFSNPLVVVVKDANGNLLPSITVNFAGTGLTVSAASATTGLNGQASVTGNPSASGSVSAVASTGGVSPTVTFTETALGDPTAALAPSAYVSLDGSSGNYIAYTGNAVTLTPTYSIPGGGGSALITYSILSGGTGSLNGGSSVTSSSPYSTGVNASPVIITYTLTVTNSLGASLTSVVTVKWVTQSVTLNVTNSSSGAIYTGSTDPDSPLYQVQVVVPDEAIYEGNGSPVLCGATTLTVTTGGASPSGPFPAGVHNYSLAYTLSTDVSYPFAVPVTVTLPFNPALSSPNLGVADLPVPFYWDATFSAWEAVGLKSVDLNANTVTFTTLLQGQYMVLGIPSLSASASAEANVMASSSTTEPFASGVDDWLQWNQGEYGNPGGSSLGMSSFAAWYGSLWKYDAGNSTKSGVALHSVFATDGDVNAQALASRLANGTLQNWNTMWQQQYWANASGTVVETNYGLTGIQTGLALITGLVVTGQPQLFLMADALGSSATNATATAIYGYSYGGGIGTFTLLDPNYPGVAGGPLSINWAPGTGVFSNYDKSAGYNPAMANFAFEGQTSVHQLADYAIPFAGATLGSPWASPPFAAIALTAIGDSSTYADLTQTQMVSAPGTDVLITGTVTNGAATPTYVLVGANGGTRVAAPLTVINATTSSFSYTLPSLANPYGTPITLETTENPCDPTFTQSGFQTFNIATLPPWFLACFEGATEPRTGSTTGVFTTTAAGNVIPPVTTPLSPAWTHQVATAGKYMGGSGLPGYPVDAYGNFVGTFGTDGEIHGYSDSAGTFNANTAITYGWTANLHAGSSSSPFVTWDTGYTANISGNTVGGMLYSTSQFSDFYFYTQYGTASPYYRTAFAGLDPHAHQNEIGTSSTLPANPSAPGATDLVPYLPMVLAGTSSYRINHDWNQGNQSNGNPFFNLGTSTDFQSAERITQVISVPTTITDPQLTFFWAAVVQAAVKSHQPPARPYIDVIVQDMGPVSGSLVWENAFPLVPISTVPTTTTTSGPYTAPAGCYPGPTVVNTGNIYYHHFYAGDPTFAGWLPDPLSATGLANPTEWVSIPWQKMTLNVKAWAGHWVRVIVSASDCTASGHAGYAYVDDLTCD